MGVLMYLVKESKKERFDLGKTRDGIYQAFGDLDSDAPAFVLSGKDDVLKLLRDANLDEEDRWPDDYLAWLAEKIATWAGSDPVVLRDEFWFSNWFDREDCRDWFETGSIFTQDWDGDKFEATECLGASEHGPHGLCHGTERQ